MSLDVHDVAVGMRQIPEDISCAQITRHVGKDGRPACFVMLLKDGKLSWVRLTEEDNGLVRVPGVVIIMLRALGISTLGMTADLDITDVVTNRIMRLLGPTAVQDQFVDRFYENQATRTLILQGNVITEIVSLEEFQRLAAAAGPSASLVQAGGDPLNVNPSSLVRAPTAFRGTYPAMPNTSDFPMFPHLPSEVRIMIWKEALQHARTIDVKTVFGFELGHAPDEWLLKSFNSVPGILQACSESRHLALEEYTPAFKLGIPGGLGAFTYLNYALDTIAVDFDVVQGLRRTNSAGLVETREKLRNIKCFIDIMPTTSRTRAGPLSAARDIVTEQEIWSILRMVYSSAVNAWAKLETWTFPCVDQNSSQRTISWIHIHAKRPEDYDMAWNTSREVREFIRDGFDLMWDNDPLHRVGIKFKYSTKPRVIYQMPLPPGHGWQYLGFRGKDLVSLADEQLAQLGLTP